jgi:hypothetical protein
MRQHYPKARTPQRTTRLSAQIAAAANRRGSGSGDEELVWLAPPNVDLVVSGGRFHGVIWSQE